MKMRTSFLKGQGQLSLTILVKLFIILLPYLFHTSYLHFTGKVAYACQSVRTNAEVLEDLCKQIGYEPFLLTATDKHGIADWVLENCLKTSPGRPIYHTNVILSLTSSLAILCSEAVEAGQRSRLEARLVSGGRGLVRVTRQQVDCLAANCYEVWGRDGRRKLVISTRWQQPTCIAILSNKYFV